MDREAAFALGREIDNAPRFTLIAVGRFKPVEEIGAATPWGVSVLADDSPTGKSVVIWNNEQWHGLAALQESPPDPAASAGSAERRDSRHRNNQQLTFF